MAAAAWRQYPVGKICFSCSMEIHASIEFSNAFTQKMAYVELL
jgi:hypothetical protein